MKIFSKNEDKIKTLKWKKLKEEGEDKGKERKKKEEDNMTEAKDLLTTNTCYKIL